MNLRTICVLAVVIVLASPHPARAKCDSEGAFVYVGEKEVTDGKADVSVVLFKSTSGQHSFCGKVGAGGILYDGLYSTFPPGAQVSVERISAASRDFIVGDSFILLPVDRIFYDYAAEKWGKLQPPRHMPHNVPLDAKWVGGPNGSQAYFRINSQVGGVISMNVYTDFRKHNEDRNDAGAMYVDSDRFVILPRSNRRVMPKDILSFIWPSIFILQDGSILKLEQAVALICIGGNNDSPLNKFVSHVACGNE